MDDWFNLLHSADSDVAEQNLHNNLEKKSNLILQNISN